jgi:hypothetical protein
LKLGQFRKSTTIGPTVAAPDDEDGDEEKYGAVTGKKLVEETELSYPCNRPWRPIGL